LLLPFEDFARCKKYPNLCKKDSEKKSFDLAHLENFDYLSENLRELILKDKKDDEI
jgi:hypothetical protein